MERRREEPLDEGLPGVEHVGADGARRQGPLPDRLEGWLAAEVDRERDHGEASFLDEPPHRNRGIEASGISEDDLLRQRPRRPPPYPRLPRHRGEGIFSR